MAKCKGSKGQPQFDECVKRKSRNAAIAVTIVMVIVLLFVGCGCMWTKWDRIKSVWKHTFPNKIPLPLVAPIAPPMLLPEKKCPTHTCPTCPPAPKCPPLVKCPDCPTCPTCEVCPVCDKCPDCPLTRPCKKCKKKKECSKCKYTNIVAEAHKCPKCENPHPKNVCQNCHACDKCKVDDKCGHCQQWERQVSLSEKSLTCSLCGMRPCKCPTATGVPVVKEPGCARNGVFSDTLSNMIYI